MSARPKGICLLAVLSVLAFLNFATGGDAGSEAASALTDQDVVGWWVVQQPEGDALFIIVKQHGRASSFFSGSPGTHIDKGRWEIAGNQLIIRWANGYTDVLERRAGLYLKYEYVPGSLINGDANGVLPARMLNTELTGSLVVSEETDKAISYTPPPEATHPPPNRSEFIGFWMTRGHREEPEYYFVQRGGKARKTEPLRRTTKLVTGDWSLEHEVLTIHWEDGSSSLIRKTPHEVEIAKFAPDSVLSDSPDSIGSIWRVHFTEGRRQFNITAAPLAKLGDYVGSWKVADENTYFILVEPWSHAKRIRFDEESRLRRLRGRWTMMEDGIHITWSNGNQTVFRQTPESFILATFPPEASVATSPATSETPVERIEERDYEDYLGEMRSKARARRLAAEQAEKNDEVAP